MLVLSRKANERIRIGHDIIVTVLRIQGNRTVIGVEAPEGVPMHRQEVYDQIYTEEGPRTGPQTKHGVGSLEATQ